MAAAGLQTLLLEVGGPSYGVTGGDLNARRPVSNISQMMLFQIKVTNIGVARRNQALASGRSRTLQVHILRRERPRVQ